MIYEIYDKHFKSFLLIRFDDKVTPDARDIIRDIVDGFNLTGGIKKVSKVRQSKKKKEEEKFVCARYEMIVTNPDKIKKEKELVLSV